MLQNCKRFGFVLWFLSRSDYFISRLLSVWAIVRDEMAIGLTTPAQREAYTSWVFSRHDLFLPGGACFEEGLLGWEWEVVKSAPFPSTGHVLVGGCGGGRDVKGLAELGYKVTAFDPAQALVVGAQEVAAQFPGCTAFCASYGDFLHATDGDGSEFAKALSGTAFDAVILSWGSFCHIPTASERFEVLLRIRKIAPKAVVFLSYYNRADIPCHGLRSWIRSALLWFGKTPAEDGDILYMKSGFIHTYTKPEIKALVAKAGYTIARARWYTDPQPYLVLVPEGTNAR